MTAAAITTPLQSLGEPRLLRGLTTERGVGLDLHRSLHGPVPDLSEADLIAACSTVGLNGRGGAGFPFARKLSSLGSGRRVVVVNATESEPASLKDRVLLERFPHLVLDGAEVVARAVGARDLWIAVHSDVQSAHLARVLAERDQPRRIRVRVQVVEGGFVSGEARAVIRALDGGPVLPPGRRELPTERGVGGRPTLLSNVETFAQVAVLASRGPAEFARVGTRHEPGTTLLTVAGAVSRPGVFEVPIGTSVDAVLSAAGAGHVAALAIGGYHGAWLPPRPDLALSHRSLTGAGGTLGAGVVLVLDERTCALGELTRVAAWLAAESAGQCGPCRFGLPALVRDLTGIARGQVQSTHDARRHAGLVLRRGACAHPDGASRFVTTGLTCLQDEVQRHRHHGGCGRAILGQLPLPAGVPGGPR